MWHKRAMQLAAFMRANNITDQDLAARVRVSRPYLNRIKNHERYPSLRVALRLVEATGLPIETFVGGSQ